MIINHRCEVIHLIKTKWCGRGIELGTSRARILSQTARLQKLLEMFGSEKALRYLLLFWHLEYGMHWQHHWIIRQSARYSLYNNKIKSSQDFFLRNIVEYRSKHGVLYVLWRNIMGEYHGISMSIGSCEPVYQRELNND